MTDHPTNQPEAVERLAEVIAAAFGPDFVTNYTDKKVARAVLAAGYRPPAPDAAQAVVERVEALADELVAHADYVFSEVCKDHGLTDSVDRVLSRDPDVRDRLGYADGIRYALAALRAALADEEDSL